MLKASLFSSFSLASFLISLIDFDKWKEKARRKEWEKSGTAAVRTQKKIAEIWEDSSWTEVKVLEKGAFALCKI